MFRSPAARLANLRRAERCIRQHGIRDVDSVAEVACKAAARITIQRTRIAGTTRTRRSRLRKVRSSISAGSKSVKVSYQRPS